MRVVSFLPVGVAIAVLGCSGETVPAPANISGTWNFTYATASASGATCQGTMTFTISQTDQTFTGLQQNSGTLACSGINEALTSATTANPNEFDNEMISSGVVSPTAVAFSLNMLESHDMGTVLPDGTMSGTASWNLPVKPSGTVVVTGTWSATKAQ